MESDCALSIDSVLLFCMLLTRWLLMNHLYYFVLSHALPWYPAVWVKSYLLKEQSTLNGSLKSAKVWMSLLMNLISIFYIEKYELFTVLFSNDIVVSVKKSKLNWNNDVNWNKTANGLSFINAKRVWCIKNLPALAEILF